MLTFLVVVVAWVFFRAESFTAATSILQSMAGMNGAVVPDQILKLIPPLGHIATGMGKVPYLADGTVMGFVEMVLMIAIGLLVVVFAPTLPELRNRWRYLLVVPCAALALQRVVYGRASEFLYYQF